MRCWCPGWDTGSGRCGLDRGSGHRGQQLAGKDGFMLDHLSIQCADVAASARSTTLRSPARRTPRDGLRGGHRLRCTEQARVLDRPVDHRPGVRQTHIAFVAPDRAAVRAFFQAAVSVDAELFHEPHVWPGYHPGYYGAFVRDPDGSNFEAGCCAPGWRPSARLSPLPAADDRAAPPGSGGA